MGKSEIMLLFLSYALHYGISIWYLLHAWDWEAMEHNLLSVLDLKGPEEHEATYFFIFFVILIPLISATINARKKYIDDRDSHIPIMQSKVFLALFTISVLQAIGIVVCVGLMLETETAFGIGFIGLLVIYVFVAFGIYRSRDFIWPLALKITNGILFGGIFIFVVAYASLDINFSKYAAVSSALMIAGVMLFLFSIVLFNRDEAMYGS
jgi:hypothetical protein